MFSDNTCERRHRSTHAKGTTICVFLATCLYLCTNSAAALNEFRIGVVWDPDNRNAVRSDKGYKLFEKSFERTFPDGFRVGNEKFSLKLIRENGGGDSASRRDAAEKLLRPEVEGGSEVHFLLGSEEPFAFEEGLQANGRARIMLHCCADESVLFERNLKYFFSMLAEPSGQVRQVVQRLPLENIQNVTIVYRSDLERQRRTCLDALKDVQSLGDSGLSVVLMQQMTPDNAQNRSFYARFAQKLLDAKTEVLIGCMEESDAMSLTNAFFTLPHPLGSGALKASYFTLGPSTLEFAAAMGAMSMFTLSTVPWHHTAQFSDEEDLSVFGNVGQYMKLHKATFGGGPPHWRTALSSGALYTIVKGIQSAFEDCDVSLTGGDVDQLLYNTSAVRCNDNFSEDGNSRIQFGLQFINLKDTIAGPVYFNKWRRNEKNMKLLTQVFNTSNVFQPRVVLPVEVADLSLLDARLRLPAENPFKPDLCPPGTFSGPDDFDPCPSCPSGTFSDAWGSQCQQCNISQYNPLPRQEACMPCPAHTLTFFRGASSVEQCVCKEDFYRPDFLPGLECFECPDGAMCDGNATLPYPMPGFWSDVFFRKEMYECEPPEACEGTSGPIFVDVCAEGYTGRRCTVCDDGFFRLAEECRACWGTAGSILMIVLVYGSWYLINKVVSDRVETVEMILNWAQLTNVVAALQLNWPYTAKKVFGAASFLDFDVDILEPSCIGEWNFVHNYVVQLMLPVLMTVIVLLGHFTAVMAFKMGLYKVENVLARFAAWWWNVPRSEAEVHRRWNSCFAFILAAVEVTYLTITRYNFDVLRCEDIAGVSVMSASVDIECDSDQYRFLFWLAIFAMGFYTLGYLLLNIWKLTEMKFNGTFSKTSNLQRYGFLYERFELEYFWSELASLIVRIFFVVVSVYVDSPIAAAALLAGITLLNLLLHVYTFPYVSNELDVLQTFLLSSLLAVSFGGIMFSNASFPDEKRRVLEGIVLLIVGAMWVVFLVVFIRESRFKFQTWCMKRRHKRVVLDPKSSPSSGFFAPLKSTLGVQISEELYHTFNTGFLYKWLKKADNTAYLEWERLNKMLKDYVADDAFMSYLSEELVAHFWRKLVENFPELIDFLAMADEDARHHFSEFIDVLYRDFFLKKRFESSLYKQLDWKDRAPLAQWLASAPIEDRKFFASVVTAAFAKVYNQDTADWIQRKFENNGKEPIGPSLRRRTFRRVVSNPQSLLPQFATSSRIKRELTDGLGPIRHVSKNINPAASFQEPMPEDSDVMLGRDGMLGREHNPTV